MAGSNFETFNPNCTNQESDAAYLADSTRVGGIAFNQTMSSLLGNKLFYQQSIMVAALGQMLANKGYSPNDGSASPSTALANLVAVLSNIVTNADTYTAANGVPFTGSGVFNALTIPSTLVTVGKVIRIGVAARCTATPSSGQMNVQVVINGQGVVASSGLPLSHINDFVKIVVDFNVASISPFLTGIAYSAAQGTQNSVSTSPSGFNGITVGAGNVTVSGNLNPIGLSGGSFEGTYVTAEVL